MKKYNKVSLFEEKRLESGLGENLKYSEMSPFDRAFLCGLIRERRPHKILEVGMSAGATTAVILNCIHILGLETKLISVDYNEVWHKDNSRKMGFVAEEFKANLPDCVFDHKVYLGNVVAAHLEEICKDEKIDFLILDTMHLLPGEVLDFIACYPYLKEDAVVVLHDVMLSFTKPKWSNAIATKTLFEAVKADKIYMRSQEAAYGLANIAAFQLTKDTGEYMRDVFFALQTKWAYFPEPIDLQNYSDLITRHYEKEYIDIFNAVVALQKTPLYIFEELEGDSWCAFRQNWAEAGNVLLYGCGYWGGIFYQYAKAYHLPVVGMVVSDEITITDSMKENFPDTTIYHLSEIPYEKDACRIVLAIGEENRELFLQNCQDKGFEIL